MPVATDFGGTKKRQLTCGLITPLSHLHCSSAEQLRSCVVGPEYIGRVQGFLGGGVREGHGGGGRDGLAGGVGVLAYCGGGSTPPAAYPWAFGPAAVRA